MSRECRVDVAWMSRGCRVDVAWGWFLCRTDVACIFRTFLHFFVHFGTFFVGVRGRVGIARGFRVDVAWFFFVPRGCRVDVAFTLKTLKPQNPKTPKP